jgi:predicted nucleic acid-binding protein
LRTVLANAGPLMALGKLNRLGLLSGLYGTVHIPRSVYREVVSVGMAQGQPDALSVRLFVERYGWRILEISPEALQSFRSHVVLDEGERELLALSRGLPGCLVLLDDEAARSEARRMGLQPKGTLGVMAQACGQGLLTLEEAEVLIEEIAARPDIWISEKLCRLVLEDLRSRPI